MAGRDDAIEVGIWAVSEMNRPMSLKANDHHHASSRAKAVRIANSINIANARG